METTVDVSQVEEAIAIAKNLEPNKILIARIVLALGVVLVRILLRVMDRLLQKYHVVTAVTSMVRTILRFFLDFIVVMIAANVAGIPMTSFVAIFSVIGIAVSLAIQGVLSNLAGGILILTTNPFEVGHYVETDGLSGTVKDVNLMYTRLLTPDGRVIFVPNSDMYTTRIINYSMQPQRRIDLTVSASYDATPSEVRKAIRAAISRVPELLSDPEPVIHLETYGESTITYSIWVWCKASDYIHAKYALNEALYDAFKENQVEMSYPHLNVHMA